MEQQERLKPSDECQQGNGCMYNEIVLNSSVWVDELPDTVEAFFFLGKRRGRAAQVALRAHRHFLRMYGLTERDVPILALRLDAIPPFHQVKGLPLLEATSLLEETSP